MARDGLQQGLALQEALGFNPLQFGLIGSTDTHNANPGDTEEWDFRGSNGLLGASAHYRVNGVPGLPNRNIAQINPGGLAAVWSEQNTRAHLFDAMQRKEVYATSGTRIRLRFFGGTALQPDVTAPENLIADAYDRGVPMGSEFVVPEGDNPGFLIIALKDPLSAPLDKIQIIKIWRADDDTHEAVHDVVCSGDREPDPITRRCPPIDATVNLADCSFDPGSGSAELTAHWFDDHFASHQNAAYYARVIEAPTCRYSTFDSLRLGIAPRQDIPATVTEMAWSSPIWVSSQGVER